MHGAADPSSPAPNSRQHPPVRLPACSHKGPQLSPPSSATKASTLDPPAHVLPPSLSEATPTRVPIAAASTSRSNNTAAAITNTDRNERTPFPPSPPPLRRTGSMVGSPSPHQRSVHDVDDAEGDDQRGAGGDGGTDRQHTQPRVGVHDTNVAAQQPQPGSPAPMEGSRGCVAWSNRGETIRMAAEQKNHTQANAGKSHGACDMIPMTNTHEMPG